MDTSPIASPSSSSTFSSPTHFTSQTSAHFSSPHSRSQSKWSRFDRILHVDIDSNDEDIENIDPRIGPSTPSKKTELPMLGNPTPSPSKFIVKGTVTPSRAAPLFARFTAIKRSSKRPTIEESSDDDDDSSYYTRADKSDRMTGSASPHMDDSDESSQQKNRHAKFITPSNDAHYGMPRLSIPVIDGFRHRVSTEDTASYLLSLRSNSLHHLHYACSGRGTTGGSSGRGILGVSRMLGAGGAQPSVSHLAFHQTFQTQDVFESNLFSLPSSHGDEGLSHPLCAEYSHSSRSLNNYQAQWLAVGDNEGRVHLLNTLDDPMASVDTKIESKPRWSACHGSVFELKWRFDDEMIATGGSDYVVRVWSPENGAQLRAFKGHRGSPRTITWDPNGGGNILVSGGRDGAVHLYDLRVHDRSKDGQTSSACLSIWEAHTVEEPARPLRGPGSRGGGRSRSQLQQQPKAVTSVAFLPGRGSNLLTSAGCADGKIRLWDLRQLQAENAATGIKSFSGNRRKLAKDEDVTIVDPLDQGIDVTKESIPRMQYNKSSHGISDIVVGSDKLFAACTDGRIYTLNCADFLQTSTTGIGHQIAPMYHDVQRGNTLYARMALHDDDRTLALGCNTGVVTVWDTHAAALSLGEMFSQSARYTGETEPGENTLEAYAGMARPAILREGHDDNFEVNSVSWAHGPQGPTLASVSDDYSIRTWHTCPRTHNMVRDRRNFDTSDDKNYLY